VALVVKSSLDNSRRFASLPAIIGFDNSLEAQIAGITSYAFGWERIGFRAVECLIRPERSIRADKNGDIKITGRIIERQSSIR
jgi:DNA-binding LacI/PurR family transcriptional regulator